MFSRSAKLLSVLFFAFFAAEVLCASELRIESMGGVSICTRDLNGDPVSFNPARAALVKKRTVVGGAGFTPYCLTYDENDTRPYYNGVIGDKRDGSDYRKMIEADVLGYYPLEAGTAGIYARYDYNSYERKEHTGEFGKVGAGVVYSTCTRDAWRSEDGEQRAVQLGILGGVKLGDVYAGLLYEKLLPYTVAGRFDRTTIDREYSDALTQTSAWTMNTDNRYSGDSVKAGTLFFPFSGASLDLTVAPSVTTYETRVTDEWQDGQRVWQDDRDAYPVQKRRYTATAWKAVMRQKTAGNIVYGLALGYTPSWSDIDINYSTYSYTIGREKAQDINIAAGLGFQMDPSFIGEIDLEYSRSLKAQNEYAWAGNGNTTKVSASDYASDTILVRMGFEKWLFKDTFALRVGGGTYFYYYRDDRQKDLTLSRTITGYEKSVDDREDFYSFGFAWVLGRDLLLEYGVSANSVLDHKAVVTCTF